MKNKILVSVLAIAAIAAQAADSSPKDDIAAAAKKVDEAPNYSWKTAVAPRNFTGTTEGKTDKEGMVALTMTFGDNTTQAFRKSGKWAVKTSDQDWQTLAELEAAAGTEPGPQQFLVRRLQNFKTPAADAADLP